MRKNTLKSALSPCIKSHKIKGLQNRVKPAEDMECGKGLGKRVGGLTGPFPCPEERHLWKEGHPLQEQCSQLGLASSISAKASWPAATGRPVCSHRTRLSIALLCLSLMPPLLPEEKGGAQTLPGEGAFPSTLCQPLLRLGGTGPSGVGEETTVLA